MFFIPISGHSDDTYFGEVGLSDFAIEVSRPSADDELASVSLYISRVIGDKELVSFNVLLFKNDEVELQANSTKANVLEYCLTRDYQGDCTEYSKSVGKISVLIDLRRLRDLGLGALYRNKNNGELEKHIIRVGPKK